MSSNGKCFAIEVFVVRGHKNVRAAHEVTLEFTKEEYLSLRGDCIVGVSSTKALRDFSEEFKELARRPTTVIITLIVGGNGVYDVVVGRGSSGLTYSDETKVIIRRSNYVSGNTAAILSDKAARDLRRDLVEYMRSGDARALVVMVATDLECFGGFPLAPNLP